MAPLKTSYATNFQHYLMNYTKVNPLITCHACLTFSKETEVNYYSHPDEDLYLVQVTFETKIPSLLEDCQFSLRQGFFVYLGVIHW